MRYLALGALFLLACSGSAPPAGQAQAVSADAGTVVPDDGARVVRDGTESDPRACLSLDWPEPARPKSTIAACAAATGSMAVSLSAPPTIALGEKVSITWSATGIPLDASINFFLVPDQEPDGAAIDVVSGGLLNHSIALCGDTHGTTEWDGQTLVLNDGDAAVYHAGQLVPGDYRIEAIVYSGKELEPILHYRVGPQPRKTYGQASSAVLRVTGSVANDDFKRLIMDGARSRVAELMGNVDYDLRGPAVPLASMNCASFAGTPEGDQQKYCATIELKSPLAGSLQTCVIRDEWSNRDPTTTGNPTYAPGVLPFPRARDEAFVAFPNRQLTDWTYREEEGGYWTFALYQSGDGRPDDVVVARVQNDGRTCLVRSYTWTAWEQEPDLAGQSNLACR